MSARNIVVPLDAFATGLESLIGDIPDSCRAAANKAVAQSTRKGVQTVKAEAGKGGIHAWSGEYVGGFSSHVTGGAQAVGEIGNKNKPGLVHLLEKGHATLNGRRTRAFPHMAPAFESIQADFIERMDKYVGEALR